MLNFIKNLKKILKISKSKIIADLIFKLELINELKFVEREDEGDAIERFRANFWFRSQCKVPELGEVTQTQTQVTYRSSLETTPETTIGRSS